MSPAACELDLVFDEDEPRSGTQRIASIVVEPTDDLASALLDACGDAAPVARLLSVRLVPRRMATATT